jgi:hypothetical protein
LDAIIGGYYRDDEPFQKLNLRHNFGPNRSVLKEELAKTRRGGDAGENQSKSKRRISR